MKYIVDHIETQRALQVWSADLTLVKAFFFFWNSGSVTQMSYQALVWALLHQILNQAPGLISIALTTR
jgi:hypothetical protein